MSLVSPGPSNLSLAAGINDAAPLFNGTALPGFPDQPSGLFWTHGIDEAASSADGGRHWTFSWPGPNQSWRQPSSLSFGDVHFGNGVVAANGTGTVAFADIFGQPCAELGGAIGTCNSSANYSAPEGLSVTVSVDGGRSWRTPAVVAAYSPEVYVSINIPPCGLARGFLPGNYTLGAPSLAFEPGTRHAVVTWTYVHNDFNRGFYCSGGITYYNVTTPQFFTFSSASLDGGLTWSAPFSHGQNDTAAASVTAGPGASPAELLAYADYNNATASGVPVAWTNSSTDGATWSPAHDLAGPSIVPVQGIVPDAYPAPVEFLHLAADSGPSSPYQGHEYLVWADNRSVVRGSPSVAFSRSIDGGMTWSATNFLTPYEPGSTIFAIPSVAVAPDGSVWVSFYGVNVTRGGYSEYARVSTDGGATWSGAGAISDAPGRELPPPLPEFGAVAGLTASSAGAFAAWADCRAIDCYLNGNQQIFAANLLPLHLDSSVGGVRAAVTTLGNTTSVALNTTIVVDAGAADTVQVPPVVPDTTGYVWAFTNWAGFSSSSANPLTTTLSAPETLEAIYVAKPAAWIEGHVGPPVPGLNVVIGGLMVALNPYNQTTEFFNQSVVAGPTYPVVVSAGPLYQPYFTNVSTQAFVAVAIDRVLGRSTGWISGVVNVPTAVVEINGSLIPVDARTGGFNATVPWGVYNVTANQAGFLPYLGAPAVRVLPGQTTNVSPVLGGAHLGGTLSPAGARVSIDGVPQVVTLSRFQSGLLSSGPHTVTALATGYSFYRTTVNLTIGGWANVTIVLTDSGWIVGAISPADGSVQLNGRPQSVDPGTGSFNFTVLGGKTYQLVGNAPGYSSEVVTVNVTPGNGTPVALNLQPKSASCLGSLCGWDLAIVVGLVVGIVVLVAVGVRMWRSPVGQPRGSPPPPPANDSDPSAPRRD